MTTEQRVGEIPIYSWFDQIPEGADLFTRKQLAERGLRPGGPVRAKVVWKRGRRWADLYALNEAKPKQQATAAQLAALEKAKQARSTCRTCGTVFSFVLPWGFVCPECEHRQWIADRDSVIQTAREIVEDPHTVFLDTETTDLEGYIVEIAIIDVQGATLLDTLVNPHAAIEDDAFAVHGIAAEQLVDAPTFAELLPRLRTILAGKTIWIYNVDFERRIFRNERDRLESAPTQKLIGWLGARRSACVMDLYSIFVGETTHEGEYRYQRLPGGSHRALGDCHATHALLKYMAQTPLSTEQAEKSAHNEEHHHATILETE
jgi:DNA polymerase-3 subunit epsilon